MGSLVSIRSVKRIELASPVDVRPIYKLIIRWWRERAIVVNQKKISSVRLYACGIFVNASAPLKPLEFAGTCLVPKTFEYGWDFARFGLEPGYPRLSVQKRITDIRIVLFSAVQAFFTVQETLADREDIVAIR